MKTTKSNMALVIIEKGHDCQVRNLKYIRIKMLDLFKRTLYACQHNILHGAPPIGFKINILIKLFDSVPHTYL